MRDGQIRPLQRNRNLPLGLLMTNAKILPPRVSLNMSEAVNLVDQLEEDGWYDVREMLEDSRRYSRANLNHTR